MSESPTGEAVVTPASTEPTGNVTPENQPAEANQETISGANTQEAVSDDSSAQQEQNKNTQSGAEVTDDGLAKFAKSQGIDWESATENEKRLLKIASDNQKAYRSQQNTKKVTDTVKELDTPKPDASEDEKFRSEFRQFKYEQKTQQFWGQDGRDKDLEPVMVDVLNEAKEKHGAAYAHTLSQDLETLYDLARLKSGATDPNAAIEQGRREERESIVKKQNASAPQAHAVSSAPSTTKIDSEWIEKTYDPSNPEHVKMVQDAMRGGLY